MNSDLVWFKSSYSGSEGGNCIEVAYAWHKSSYSGDEGGACVEVAACPEAVHVRDSKDVTRPGLITTLLLRNSRECGKPRPDLPEWSTSR